MVHTGNVSGDRLFDEGVNATFNRRAIVLGTKSGRCRQQCHVDARIHDFFIGIEATENAAGEICGGLGGGRSVAATELAQLQDGLVLIKIAHRPELTVVVSFQCLRNRTRTAATTANQADLELFLVAFLAKVDVREGQGARGCADCCCGSGLLDETAPGRAGRRERSVGWGGIFAHGGGRDGDSNNCAQLWDKSSQSPVKRVA